MIAGGFVMEVKIELNTDLKMHTIEEIETEEVRWIWRPFLHIGKITLIQSDPGIGKLGLILAIAAAITTGAVLPDGGGIDPATMIYQNAEDCYSDTIKPRLLQLGADCEKIHVIDEGERGLSLCDERIEEAIIKTGAKLFVLDPLSAYLGGADMHSVNGVRPLMKHLADVAERTDCACVLISHLNKKNGGQSQYRGLGSIDIIAAARSVLTVGKLSLDDTMCAIVQTKNNLAPLGESQAFGFDEISGFTWLGSCNATIDEILTGKAKAESQFAKARRLLESKLSNGAVPAIEIMERSE
jgi:hypothetical protein